MLIAALISLLASAPPAAAPPIPPTVAEKSNYLRTGRYEEVLALCAAYARAYPALVKCSSVGKTPEGREIAMLIVSAGGFEPKKDKPVVMIQAGIHAGEIDGKDAGFWALKDLLARRDANALFGAITLLFVPVFNADGHERFGPNHRINQRGPAEMGWRTTAENYNLNRDYMKADAPEMRAMLKVLRDWDPILYVDLHVTDGADFQYDIAVLVEPADAGPEEMRAPGVKLRQAHLDAFAKQKYLALPFYPSFTKDDDPSSGFAHATAPPRFALGYWALQNRFSVLIETHSWKPYKRRVAVTYAAIMAGVDAVARDGRALRAAAGAADSSSQALGGKTEIPLAWEPDGKVKMIDFLGFKYTRTLSAVSGGMKVSYDPSKPEIWKIPLLESLKPSLVVNAPRAGYVVPAAHAWWIGERLREHGVAFEPMSDAKSGVEAEVYRIASVEHKKTPFEGRMQVSSLKGAWQKEKVEVPAGSLWVPIAQPRARVVMSLFEPEAPDSYFSWGFFNAFMERKEYMEAYVAEQVAEEMLAKNPALAKEFTSKLEAEPDFAASPAKRLEFFYRRHPAWDDRVNRYPILKSHIDFTRP